jgi:hypothetical protein
MACSATPQLVVVSSNFIFKKLKVMRKFYVFIILLCAIAVSAFARVAACMQATLFFTYRVCKTFFVHFISTINTPFINCVLVFFKANTTFVYNTNYPKNNTTLLPKNLHIDYEFFENK